MVLIICIFMLADSQDGALCTGVCTVSIILQLAFQDIWTSKKKGGLFAFFEKENSSSLTDKDLWETKSKSF